MKNGYLLVLSVFLLAFCSNQPDTVEERMASRVISLADSNDFGFLKPILKDKRIVILGEAGHYDGTTFVVRNNLIRYLRQELDFDVVGLETFGFTVSATFYAPGGKKPLPLFDLAPNWSELWSETAECRDFLQSVRQGDIEVFGFDVDNNDNSRTIDCLRQLVSRYDSQLAETISWKNMKEVYNEMLSAHSIQNSVAIDKRLSLWEHLTSLENHLRRSLREKKEPVSLADSILQCIRNITTQYRMSHYYMQTEDFTHDNSAITINTNLRDRQMAENIIWYMNKYPDKKVIIWCANFHGAKDISQTINPADSTMYTLMQTMGEHLAESFGEQLYSMAFTYPAYGPSDCFENRLALPVSGLGYIDFTSLRYDKCFFDQSFTSNALGAKTGKWMSVFDGMFIIKNQRRSIPLR